MSTVVELTEQLKKLLTDGKPSLSTHRILWWTYSRRESVHDYECRLDMALARLRLRDMRIPDLRGMIKWILTEEKDELATILRSYLKATRLNDEPSVTALVEALKIVFKEVPTHPSCYCQKSLEGISRYRGNKYRSLIVHNPFYEHWSEQDKGLALRDKLASDLRQLLRHYGLTFR